LGDDAVGVEAMLHRDFAAQRLNNVNPRKEFFRVTPQAVVDALKKYDVAVLEFNTHAPRPRPTGFTTGGCAALGSSAGGTSSGFDP
jgi:hypothetical protein